MKRKHQVTLLSLVTAIGIALLPFAIVKRSFKDWIIVYLVSAAGNLLADTYLVKKGFIQYKIRPFPDKFKIHLPFDLVHNPLLLLYYNQWALNSRPLSQIFKVLLISLPQVMMETIAEKKTNLITWRKGWTWYHSFFSMMGKFFICRLIIAFVRKINRERVSVT
ncbi:MULTISPECIES: CBO0543 family protein [Heyndrickxia]|uniref:Uncharacterized protein n=2 Tax=Heyndrickxia TaxID=2837504 RepID=G2TMZ4_HEYCO|nr:CBO0543 family protein [Heyndrickxia coagulans]AEP01217.1 hypothetical protein Bcoa_2033 [Heyndrickxia coagulans 36D1]AWP38094.1 hypothetical protein CYJ15_14545 [Heyndrickxia coagulans]QDI60406.1 hypothetical protein DXF96_02055 [Heyndrickxia coagulans]